MLRRSFLAALPAFAWLADASRSAFGAPARKPILLQTSPVAGFQYHDGETVWASLAAGAPLKLVREADNPRDANAVRVDWNGSKLGYVPRAQNHAVAQLMDRGERVSARIDVLRKSRDPWERVGVAVLLEA